LLLSERISTVIFLLGISAVDLPYPVIEYTIFMILMNFLLLI